MGGRISHCSSEGQKTGGCAKLKFIRDAVTGNDRDLDTTILLPLKATFYVLASILVLLMLGRQIALYRAKQTQQKRVVLEGMDREGFVDGDGNGDGEKGSLGPYIHALI